MDRPENSKKEYRKRQTDAENNVKSKESNNVKSNKWQVKDNVEENGLKERNAENEANEMKDVLEINNGTAKVMGDNEINGIEGRILNKDSYGYKIGVWNIRGMNTFEKQNKVMNLMRSENLKVRIVVGWDADETNVQVLHKSVIAVNDGLKRRSMWKELVKDSRYVNGKP
ncbi:hypothetical protein Tco_1149923 [Tanacetum coccineum]